MGYGLLQVLSVLPYWVVAEDCADDIQDIKGPKLLNDGHGRVARLH